MNRALLSPLWLPTLLVNLVRNFYAFCGPWLIMLPATIFLSRSQFCPFLPGMRLPRTRTLLRLSVLNTSEAAFSLRISFRFQQPSMRPLHIGSMVTRCLSKLMCVIGLRLVTYLRSELLLLSCCLKIPLHLLHSFSCSPPTFCPWHPILPLFLLSLILFGGCSLFCFGQATSF
jgi:hypothetical protein